MNKKELYQQIERFNNKLTNPSDRTSKSYEKAYLYVDSKNAKDKADFIDFLIKQGYMQQNYKSILDLAFGSGNLTSHIVFDNDIKYENIIFNDINTVYTNQDIINYVDDSNISYDDMLDAESFENSEADLVIVNPQIGGSYIEGNILGQKEEGEKEQDILDKLGLTLNSFFENDAIILFYGEEKDFKLILPESRYIKYKSKLKDIFIISKAYDESLCFEKDGRDFVKCIELSKVEDDIKSFDDLAKELDNCDNQNSLEDKEEKEMMQKEKFIIESVMYNFPHKNLLLKGVPGTGKSHTLDNIIKDKLKLTEKEHKVNILRINIHSASSNADLMQGIGISSNSGNIEYKEKQGLIYNHIKKALFAPNQPFVLVLEEIQENSLNELIGDLIYLIEDKKRVIVDDSKFNDGKEYEYQAFIDEVLQDEKNEYYIEIPYLVDTSTDYRKMVLPSNLYIFCTSNYRDDKKVIEDNLLRRFDVVEIYPQTQEQLGKEVFESSEISDFLYKLNQIILKKFKDEIHPDRYLVGHANWLKITNDDNKQNTTLFYTALLKVIIEFKEIREVDFKTYVEPILKDLFKDGEHLSEQIKKHIEECDFKYESYKEMIEKLQKKIYDFVK